ncbi:glutathione S-transferase C-terminal domain-containing protein-like [Acanthaster planci]|uniref:Glutathione S-transferase C-terminal domain-containing protein-like n=1 Tax=Acanthaster planci TaxID=133434 RepID=A0A8B7XWW1_ACAPL|nr:glutathione S-transferase C-terminal domain-containing protein-like [Acanthaster planci]XP_022084526.1 glutathione S-transferase C-terminal domain-containing protein-like [Acanthaster planci]XP_022084527.1 glutathione S-transferase C-terminal domain-containing protein-like [Acanthaster planci]
MHNQGKDSDLSLKERLYLPVKGRCLARQTQTVLFLCQYCGHDSFDVILVQTAADHDGKLNLGGKCREVSSPQETACQGLDPSQRLDAQVGLGGDVGPLDDETVEVPSVGQAKGVDELSPGYVCLRLKHSVAKLSLEEPEENTSSAGISEIGLNMQLPPDLEASLKHSKDIDWLAQQCQLPAIIGSGGLTCFSGLCTVLRRIVKKAHQRHPEKKLEALLGFNQACLKKCSEVSPWTKICEVDIYQDLEVNSALPQAILELEKQLASPTVISSKLLGKAKKKKQATVGRQSERAEQGEIQELESFFHSNSLHLVDKHQIKIAKSLYKEQLKSEISKNCTNSSCRLVSGDEQPGSISLERNGSSNERPRSQMKRTGLNTSSACSRFITSPCKKKSGVTAGSPAPPKHLFAQGPYITLCDFALFHNLHTFLQSCMEEGKGHDPCRGIPLVCRWYKRMWNVPSVRECALHCGLKDFFFPEEIILSDYIAEVKPEVTNEDSTGIIADKIEAVQISRLPSMRNRVPEIIRELQVIGIKITVDDFPVENIQLPWDTFPEYVNPSKDVSEERAMRKRQQIENLVAAVKMITKSGDIIVDFCSGGGHVGIALAHCLPDCRVIMVESNEESVKRVEARIQGTRPSNISLCQCNLNYFTGRFDIGVSLHACGVATDMVLEKCLRNRAAFVCSPCCYGSARDSHLIKYPRSQRFQGSALTYRDHLLVSHVAEQTSRSFESEMAKQAKVCMSILDTDRAEAAREQDYHVGLYSMCPATCSPKNNLLVGMPCISRNSLV